MNIFTLTLKIKTVSKSGRLYQPNSQKLERVGTSGERFYPCDRNEDRKSVRGMFLAQLLKILEVKEETKEIAEREPARRLDRSFLLGERNESN